MTLELLAATLEELTAALLLDFATEDELFTTEELLGFAAEEELLATLELLTTTFEELATTEAELTVSAALVSSSNSANKSRTWANAEVDRNKKLKAITIERMGLI